ncbi:hypothetical protein KFK09_008006 [Dendrobium nobile]|uniref:Uncharacterized protein n=1 Tax=Dendrobium nobile TaxID=94219 RepID=A0A8T3BVP3_DENNO|nr:hypothetical protein KFK09_008006 [Dendrobium nobile]
MGKLYAKTVPPPDLNKNTEWFMYPGVWTTYIFFLFFFWLIVLSVFGCNTGMAWTIVNLAHFIVTYQFFHWKKGTPFAEDQGIYNRLTWWEQIDSGKQLTSNRKFLTIVPVVLCHHTKVVEGNLAFIGYISGSIMRYWNLGDAFICKYSLLLRESSFALFVDIEGSDNENVGYQTYADTMGFRWCERDEVYNWDGNNCDWDVTVMAAGQGRQTSDHLDEAKIVKDVANQQYFEQRKVFFGVKQGRNQP